MQLRNECPCEGEGLEAQARRALAASAGQGEGLQHHTPLVGLGEQLPLFTAPGTPCSEAGPSLAQTSLRSLSCTEQSLTAWDRGQELLFHGGHGDWLYLGGRGDGGLSRGREAIPKAPGAVLLLAGPQL